MKRSEIRTFLQQGVAAIQQPDFTLLEGLYTDWNKERAVKYPCIFIDLSETETDYPVSAPLDSWAVSIWIGNQDKLDSKPEQYEDIVDQMDLVAKQLIYQYRTITEGYALTVIESSKREKFVKKNADIVTGVNLTFAITGADQTDVCGD